MNDPLGTLLDVPFHEKDWAKSLGARWSGDLKRWYVPVGRDVGPFARWLPAAAALMQETAHSKSPPELVALPFSLRMRVGASVYVGQSAGSEAWHRLENASRSVAIVSPYLATGFVELLARLEERGVTVTLVTTDKLFENRAFGRIGHHLVWQEQRTDVPMQRRRQRGMRLSLLAALLSSGLFLFGGPLVHPALAWQGLLGLLVFGSVFFVYQGKAVYSYAYLPRLTRLKVILASRWGAAPAEDETPSLHFKGYVIDDEVAYLGSLNFTGAGFFDNFESCVRVEDRAAVEQLGQLVSRLCEHGTWQAVGEDAVAREMLRRGFFREPKN